MSLAKKTVLDETVNDLQEKSWDLAMLTYDLWKFAVHEGKQPNPLLLKNIKKLAREVREITRELP